MATDALPAAFARDPDLTAAAVRTRGDTSMREKPPLLRRLYDAVVEAQTRRAEREIARLVRTRKLSLMADLQRRPQR